MNPRPSPISAILAASAIMGGHSLANPAIREMPRHPIAPGPRYRRPRRESTRARKLRMWREGTCLQNRLWYLRRCEQHGHQAQPTVWDDHLPAGTI